MAKYSITAILGIDSSKAGAGLKTLGSKFGTLGKAMAAAGVAAAAAIAIAAAKMIGFGVSAVKEFVSFEKGMSEVFTLLPKLSGTMKKEMSDDLLDLVRTMGILPEKAIPALYQAISAGVPKENVMAFLKVASKAAIGGVTDLEVAVDGLTSVINAYGRENLSAEEAADAMFTTVRLGKTTFEQLAQNIASVTPVAQAAGISFKDLMAMIAALTKRGVPTAAAMTQIQRAILSITAASPGAREMAKGMGFDFRDLAEMLKKPGGMLEAFQILHDKTGGNIGEMKDLMGRVQAVNGVMGLMANGAKDLTEAIAAQAQNAGAHGEAFQEMEGTMGRMVEKMSARWKAFVTVMGEGLAPILAAFGPLMSELLSAFEKLPWDEFKAHVGELAVLIKEEFGQGGKAAFKEVAELAFELLKHLIDIVSWTVKFLVTLKPFFAVAMRFFQLCLDISQQMLSVFTEMIPLINTVVQLFADLIMMAIELTAAIIDFATGTDTATEALRGLEAEEKKREKANLKRSRHETEGKHIKRLVSEGMSNETLQGLANILSGQQGKQISIEEMMENFKSGKLEKQDPRLAAALHELTIALALKTEKEMEKGREMLIKSGMTKGMMETLGLSAEVDAKNWSELWQKVGSGQVDLNKTLTRLFGEAKAKELMEKMGRQVIPEVKKEEIAKKVTKKIKEKVKERPKLGKPKFGSEQPPPPTAGEIGKANAGQIGTAKEIGESVAAEFPDCIALCDETIDKLAAAIRGEVDGEGEGVDEEEKPGGVEGPKKIIPGIGGHWEVPMGRGGAARGAAVWVPDGKKKDLVEEPEPEAERNLILEYFDAIKFLLEGNYEQNEVMILRLRMLERMAIFSERANGGRITALLHDLKLQTLALIAVEKNTFKSATLLGKIFLAVVQIKANAGGAKVNIPTPANNKNMIGIMVNQMKFLAGMNMNLAKIEKRLRGVLINQ
jgi:TP901 family phage tail tape measure protein